MLPAAVSLAAAGAPRGRFAADEIIVRFRTPPADANASAAGPTTGGKSLEAQELQKLRGRYHVREIKPLLKGLDQRRWPFVAGKKGSPARLVRARRYLLDQRRHADIARAPDPGRIYRVRVDLAPGQSLEEVLAAYRGRPDVESAELNPVISICAMPNDRLAGEQWLLGKIQAPEAWDTCRGDHEIIVAVIDTGVDYNHRDLRSNMWVNEAEVNGVAGVDDDGNGYIDDLRGYNFIYNNDDPLDDHGHGTHCAGTIAAVGNNGLDIAGICWTARIMPLKALGAAGDGTAADAVPAIYYAIANGADVISISWGGDDGSDMLREAVAYAQQQGVVVVAAAGNQDAEVPYFPAAFPEVISVTATESDDHRWYLSNYGDWVDLAAPGRDVLSLRAAGTSAGSARDAFTCKMSGTSTAAPQVSGACALLLSAHPLLTCIELHEILTRTGDPVAPGICASNSRLNVYKALRAAIPAEGLVRLDRASYAERAEMGLLLADWDLRGSGEQAVLMETDDGDLETVVLTETGISLGVFRGALASQSAVATPGNGVLEIRDGESIHARYLDGNGDPNQVDRWRQADAVADYRAPTLSELGTERNGPMARIELSTSEPTLAEVRYGGANGGPYTLAKKSLELSDRHKIELHGLKPDMPQWFVVALVDAAGNETLADNGGAGYALAPGGAFAGFRVPDVYPTIQAAIDEAGDGDVIWVADGTYSGDGNIEIDFRGRAITVRSENGPAACIIDCQAGGRAFYFHTGETPNSILDGFTITNGGADYGGGIRCMASSPAIRNCVLIGNSAQQYGGGLCNCYGSHPVVANCTFEENSCSSSNTFGRGGGMANRQGSSPTVSDCLFRGNSATYSAGAMGNFDASSPSVVRCTFRDNAARYSGGAVANWDTSRATFQECVFSGNQARDDGGAICNLADSTSRFENCIMNGNHADGVGGAMKNYAATANLANCTVSGNQAQESCGGIWSGAASVVRLDNCILWANADGSGGQAEPAQTRVEDSAMAIQYCDVQGWSGTLGGLGNFGLDPLFADPNSGDFHLKSQGGRWDAGENRWVHDAETSPCIDAGNPGWPLGEEPAGVPDDPNDLSVRNVRIDMGAYGGTAEASLPPSGRMLRADLDNDGAVDWLDLTYLAAGWLQAGEKHATDLTRDGTTDGADLALLAREWRHHVRLPVE
jgi:predicted outer membrane repeat protein